MVKPEIISEKPISIAELRKEIDTIKKRDTELNFRSGRTEEYVNNFSFLSKTKEDELIKKLNSLDIPRLKEHHIVKIVDILPKTADDLKLILQGYTVKVSNENIKKIVSVIKEFAEKKK